MRRWWWGGGCRGCCSLCDATDRRLMGRCCSGRNILIGLPWLYFPSCLGHLSGTVGFCWRCTQQNLLFSVLEKKVSELTEAIYCSSSAVFWVQNCCCQIPSWDLQLEIQTVQINMLKSEFLCCIETGSVTGRNEQIWCIFFSCVATEGYSNQWSAGVSENCTTALEKLPWGTKSGRGAELSPGGLSAPDLGSHPAGRRLRRRWADKDKEIVFNKQLWYHLVLISFYAF